MRLGRHTPSGCGSVRSHRIRKKSQCHVAQLLSCLFFQQNKALAAPHTGQCGSAGKPAGGVEDQAGKAHTV
jgi:hypothetical protein